MTSEAQAKANEICGNLIDAGFSKVCIVNKSYQVEKSSDQSAVPSAWVNSENVQVNENQELANDWSKATTFCFFKEKFNVLQKSANHIVGSKGKDVIVGKEYAARWIIAFGKTKGMGAKKGGEGNFANAPAAYTKACSAAFDELDEDED